MREASHIWSPLDSVGKLKKVRRIWPARARVPFPSAAVTGHLPALTKAPGGQLPQQIRLLNRNDQPAPEFLPRRHLQHNALRRKR
jgi:hypothetical protein